MWKDLPSLESFALYDLAVDGFTNYKNIDTVYSFYRKGLLKTGSPSRIIEQKLSPLNSREIWYFRNK